MYAIFIIDFSSRIIYHTIVILLFYEYILMWRLFNVRNIGDLSVFQWLVMKKLFLLIIFMLPLTTHAGLMIVDDDLVDQTNERSTSAMVQIKPFPEIWIGAEGSTLHDSLVTWSKKANWHVIWDAADIDYQLLAPVQFEGSFDEAATAFIKLYEKAKKPLLIDVQKKQRLIHITRKL